MSKNYYYGCNHRSMTHGHKCDYEKREDMENFTWNTY